MLHSMFGWDISVCFLILRLNNAGRCRQQNILCCRHSECLLLCMITQPHYGLMFNQEQYRFCHEMVQTYLEEFATYANFKWPDCCELCTELFRQRLPWLISSRVSCKLNEDELCDNDVAYRDCLNKVAFMEIVSFGFCYIALLMRNCITVCFNCI
jgi:hypothetical protein